MFLAFAAHSNFKVYQMDVKSAFLNGELDEKVYVEQPLILRYSEFLDFVYFLFKAIYGLKQSPRKWYDTLSGFLIENSFVRGVIDKTFFTKIHKSDMLLVQVYVDDIIFGSTNDNLCKRFAKLMQSKFEMSLMGELKLFSWIASRSKVRLYIYLSILVSQRTPQEIQHGGFIINENSIIYRLSSLGHVIILSR